MKLNSLNKNANSSTEKNSSSQIDSSISNNRSRRPIKKTKEDSFTSDINDEEEDEIKNMTKENLSNSLQLQNYPNDEANDIIMEGNLIYRYGVDQIELEGDWSISSEYSKEKFSYLLLKKKSSIQVLVNKKEIDFSHLEGGAGLDQNSSDNFVLNISSGNIFEVLLIPNQELFNAILIYLTGEYHGFFVYYSKTIEDRFVLNFSFENNQVRVSGEGTNNLGSFNIIGYVNFYTIKDDLISNNSIESDVIKFGMIKITRIYNAFNSNENIRVIKSFQHSRKKYEDDFD